MIQLDIGNVANSFCLFRLPRVKEILGRKIEHFIGSPSVDTATIPYLDRNKERQHAQLQQQRQAKFERKKEELIYKQGVVK